MPRNFDTKRCVKRNLNPTSWFHSHAATTSNQRGYSNFRKVTFRLGEGVPCDTRSGELGIYLCTFHCVGCFRVIVLLFLAVALGERFAYQRAHVELNSIFQRRGAPVGKAQKVRPFLLSLVVSKICAVGVARLWPCLFDANVFVFCYTFGKKERKGGFEIREEGEGGKGKAEAQHSLYTSPTQEHSRRDNFHLSCGW